MLGVGPMNDRNTATFNQVNQITTRIRVLICEATMMLKRSETLTYRHHPWY